MKNKKDYPEFKHIDKALQRFIALCFPFAPPTQESLNAGIKILNNYLLNKIKTLYKYTNIITHSSVCADCDKYPYDKNRFFDDLASGIIRCNKPANFNDPFDYYPIFADKEYLMAALEKRALAIISRECPVPKGSKIQLQRSVVDGIHGFHEHLLDNFRNKMQVSCFSTKCDEILMWSHYADSHKGVCVEYALCDSKLINHILPVVYVSDMFDITEYFAESLSQFFVNLYGKGVFDNSDLPRNFNPWSTTLFGLMKYDRWKYENEWRLIFHNDLPGVDLSLRVKSAFLGLRIAKEHRERILDIAHAHRFDVYSMQMKNRKYEVVPKLLYSGEKGVFVSDGE